MRRNKKLYRTLSPPVDFWFISTVFLSIIFVFFSLFLIKERLFLNQMKFYLEEYKIYLNDLNQKNLKITNGHLLKTTNPISSNNIFYLTKENYTIR